LLNVSRGLLNMGRGVITLSRGLLNMGRGYPHALPLEQLAVPGPNALPVESMFVRSLAVGLIDLFGDADQTPLR
jgi:hypothetical protein